MDVDKMLDSIYNDPNSVAGFASLKKLYDAGKKLYPSLKLSDVDTYLRSQNSHTEYARRRYKFLKRPVFISKPNHSMTADLADFTNLSDYNKGYKYVLFILDYFSRKLSVYTIKDKKSDTIASCFNDHLTKNPFYKYLHVDEGKEFYARSNLKIMKKYGVKMYSVKNRIHKAATAERCILTIKHRLFKILDYHNSKNYISHINDIVKTYNRTPHSGLLGLTPNLVHKLENGELLEDLAHVLYLNKFKNYSPRHIYNTKIAGPTPFDRGTHLDKGDFVRLQNTSSEDKFNKSYLPGYTREIFTIDKIYRGPPPHFRIKDLNGENVDGTFYYQELKRVILPKVYQIEKIIKSKKI